MLTSGQNIRRHLLPAPKRMGVGAGQLSLDSTLHIEVQTVDARVARAAERWLAALAEPASPNVPASRVGSRRTRLLIAVDPNATFPAPGVAFHPDAYRLTIARERIELVGASPQACVYALTTLGQLAQAAGGNVPSCTIEDWPDFVTRGVLIDVTRGRVPTLATLTSLVDRLASLKINQLQLNIEHAFVFPFDPEICNEQEGLTADEVRSLDAYCRERFIDLVPAVATFGHMGRILSMPKYRHLAEVEATESWTAMTWPERMRGFTLDCKNPEAHRLVEHLWSDIFEAFGSPVVNICGDEPHDLGRGKNCHLRETNRHEAVGVAYIDQIRRTYDLGARNGRRVQAWSDVVGNYPALFHRLPNDITILHWGYDDNADYEGTHRFTDAGLSTIVCPGTSGWKRIINGIGLAERNITSFSAAASRHGASGLLTTDWGDHGHFNLPACSWHGIALGAACAWSADAGADEFDERFARVIWSTDDTSGVSLLRGASKIADTCETWRLMWQPLADTCGDPQLPSADAVTQAGHDADRLVHWLDNLATGCGPDDGDRRELTTAARFTQLFAEKVALVHRVKTAGFAPASTTHEPASWAARMAAARDMYAACWEARYKPSGLDDILRALSDVVEDVRTPLPSGGPSWH